MDERKNKVVILIHQIIEQAVQRMKGEASPAPLLLRQEDVANSNIKRSFGEPAFLGELPPLSGRMVQESKGP